MGIDLLQISIVLLVVCLIVKPLGIYLYQTFRYDKTKWDRFYLPIEKWIYRLSGIQNLESTGWKGYAVSILCTNAALLGIAYILLRIQYVLPSNPNGIKGMEPTLTFNTVASFVTNTNLQHYSGESGLSYFSQMAVITMLMFAAAGMGLAVFIAFVRGLTSRGECIGNFFVDFVRSIVRVLLPASILFTLALVSCGVPQTLAQNRTIMTIEGAKQTIALGPIASLEAIKQIGNNGGGFFGANSAHPFENPNWISNILQIIAMVSLTAALPFTYGKMAGKKQGKVLFVVMFLMLLVFIGITYKAEISGNPALTKLGFATSQGSMEGKEVRFGPALSAMFAAITGATETGAVNTMHDTLTPLGGLVPMMGMMFNTIFGGIGVGLMNVLLYVTLAVFLAGLMVGRTPELLGRKIEPKEMKLIVIVLLCHPLFILLPTAISFFTAMGTSAISNSGFHGISQILYEFTSSAANNGSGFEGLGDNTPFWNISTGIVMLLGRYISIIALLAVASSLMKKQPVPETIGTFRTDNATFGAVLVGTILIIGALTFFPVVVLGPVAEFLSIR